jgi:hypothetical protein
MSNIKTYTWSEIQTVYRRHHYNCGSVLSSEDGGYTWRSVEMDTGKWKRDTHGEKPILFAFIEVPKKFLSRRKKLS